MNLGSAMTGITREDVEGFVRDFVSMEGERIERAEEFAEEVLARSRRTAERVGILVRDELRRELDERGRSLGPTVDLFDRAVGLLGDVLGVRRPCPGERPSPQDAPPPGEEPATSETSAPGAPAAVPPPAKATKAPAKAAKAPAKAAKAPAKVAKAAKTPGATAKRAGKSSGAGKQGGPARPAGRKGATS